MSKEINKLIPELRFPEFVNEGEWKVDLLGELVDIKGRIGYRGYTTADIVKKGEGAITLSPSNFDENGSLNFEKCTYISWEKYEESPEIMLEEGQTVLVKTASVGKTAYVQKLPVKATVNPQIVVLKPKKIQNRFLAYTISHQNIQNQIKNCVGAGAIPNLSQESISKFVVLTPPDKEKQEQQKIASCLSSLDKVIATHSEKLELLKDHKKGLMQNLFPQEGEKVPKYRFPEFKNDGKWLENRLDLITDKIGDGIHTTPIYDVSGEYYFINGNNLIDGKIYIYDKTKKVSSEEYEKHKKELNDSTILLSINGTIGNVSYYNSEKVILGKSACYINTSKKLNRTFLFYYLQTDEIKSYFDLELTGSTIKNLSLKSIRETIINLPSDKEQQKLAECLSALDGLINAQTEKIEQLKLHKKGLLQGLFPKMFD